MVCIVVGGGVAVGLDWTMSFVEEIWGLAVVSQQIFPFLRGVR